MSSRSWTRKFTENDWDNIGRLKTFLSQADGVMIGAGAGLSTSAGFVYHGERFQRYFSDFIEKYGFRDMYSGGFYPFTTLEEHWAYWSRYIYLNRYLDAPKPVYPQLFRLIQDKTYFVLTTNVDHCFQKAGFDKNRLFYTQGDFGLFQCSEPCCQETFENVKLILQMVERQRGMRIPSELVPRCPHCGKPMTMNLRADDTFVQDAGWYEAANRYQEFAERHQTGRVLYLELGVGYNTPGIIKYPFWRAVHQNPEAMYACVNMGEALCPREIAARSVCIEGDIGEVLEHL